MLELEVVVDELDLVVVVHSKHGLGAYSQAETAVRELPQLHLEDSGGSDGGLSDEVDPVAGIHSFDAKPLGSSGEGEAGIVGIVRMRLQ